MNAKKILVIDFDQSFLQFMTENLAKQGFQVLTATDGFSGFWKYKAEAPDLVLSEILLPKLHGFELCSRIHADTEKKTPVIFITGVQKDESYRKEAMETFGAVDYFDKPVNISVVMNVIRRVLGMPGEASEPAAEPEPPVSEAAKPRPQEIKPVPDHAPPEQTPTVVAPASAAAERAKPKRRTTDVTDIDALLKGTLDEIGFQRKEKTTKTDMDKIPAAPRTPAAPPAAQPAAPRPPARPATGPTPVQRKTDAPETIKRTTGSVQIEKVDIFDTYKEPSEKKGFPVIPVIGVLIVIAAALFFFVLKPGSKSSTESSTASSLAAKAIAQQSQVVEEPETPIESEIEEPPAQEQEPPPPEEKPAPAPAKSETERKTPPAPEPAAIMTLPEAALAVDKPAASKPEPKAPPAKETMAPPQPSVKAGDIVPIQSVDVEPQLLKRIDPAYPETARRLRIEGTVIINMLISETGEVIDARTVRGIKGYPAFEKAAESAVRKWRFRPATKDGVPVRVWKVENFAFRL